MKKHPDGNLYEECLYNMIQSCADYIKAVVNIEALRQNPSKNGTEYREKFSQLDQRRTIAHDNLISQIKVVNRICLKIGIEPICPDELSRAEYGDLALSIVRDFFENRTR